MEHHADLEAQQQQYDDTPELARAHELPEVYNPETASYHHGTQATGVQQQEWSPLQSNPSVPLPKLPQTPAPVTYSKQDESIYGNNRQTMDSAAASTLHHYAAEPRESRPPYPASTRGGGGGAFGPSSRLVLILSILCGILGMTVVGLAAGTGVVAGRYADSSLKLEQMSSSYSALEMMSRTVGSSPSSTTTTSASSTPTSYSKITNGCSDDPQKVSGETFTSQLDGVYTFTMYCDRETEPSPLMAVFTENFNTCMEACASWNNQRDLKSFEGKKCKGVTFAPSWANTTEAKVYSAPGDCYLKPNPLDRDGLKRPTGSVEVHSALILDLEDDEGKDKDSKASSTSKSSDAKETSSAKS